MTNSSRITILGSGTCVPSLVRNPCSFLLQTGGHSLLFDCGSGVMRRLLEVGASIFDISHVFISHFHPDHTGELASILFALKYPAPSPQKHPLTIVAGHGFKSFFKRLKALYGNPAPFLPLYSLEGNCVFSLFYSDKILTISRWAW